MEGLCTSTGDAQSLYLLIVVAVEETRNEYIDHTCFL